VGIGGLWVEGLVTAMSRLHDVRVISPVPYCPPLPEFIGYVLNRKILERNLVHDIEVYRPRFLSPPGYLLHSYIGDLVYWSIVRKIDFYRKEFPFDLIHAHFSYPDGYVGARLAKRYHVPLIITEHATWKPWMDDYPRVRKQAVWAASVSAGLIAGSRYLSDSIKSFINDPQKLHDIPIGVNTELFKPAKQHIKNPMQILYVGRIHRIKGVDVLFKAFSLLVKKQIDIHLILIGGNLGTKSYQRHEENMRALATSLGINNNIKFLGMQPPEKVLKYMQESILLVLPSRRETFGTVLIESLACGTPVVATRCGGPEDIVNDKVGVLVEKENPAALAAGIEQVLSRAGAYSAEALHQYVDKAFSWISVAQRTSELYEKSLSANR